MSPTNAPLIEAEPESSRLPTLLWLAWRFLPPLDRWDRKVLGCVALACGYLAVPLGERRRETALT